jgi:U1 small nuclear ribonucleoprotein
MTDKLPPNLLALFAARPPLRWVEAPDYAPQNRKTAPISGVAQFLPELQKYKETDVYHPTESWLQRRDRKKREKKEKLERLVTEAPEHYRPDKDTNIRGDAFKTLIVARLSYEADEKDLEKEFGRFGPIERVCDPREALIRSSANIITDSRCYRYSCRREAKQEEEAPQRLCFRCFRTREGYAR